MQKNTEKKLMHQETTEQKNQPRTESMWHLFIRATLLSSASSLQGVYSECICELECLHTNFKNMRWEAGLRSFTVSATAGFPPNYFHEFSFFGDKSLLEDNAIWIASDIGLISLCLLIFPALPYFYVYTFEIREIQGLYDGIQIHASDYSHLPAKD